jgi:hypothetical protein
MFNGFFDRKPKPQPGDIRLFISAATNDKRAELESFIARFGKNAVDAREEPKGTTALMRAARYGGDETCIWLIRHGAKVKAKDKDGWTPLRFTIEGNLKNAPTLIENGAEVDARDNKGETPLIAAAFRGKPEAVRFFLDHGADPRLRNNVGKSAADVDYKGGTPERQTAFGLIAQYVNEALKKIHAREQQEKIDAATEALVGGLSAPMKVRAPVRLKT